jgi:hypothetical protein
MSHRSDVIFQGQLSWKLHVCTLLLDNKSRSCGKTLFTQIPIIIIKISKVDRSPLVGNLGSPATLILERPSWDAGKHTIRKAEIATVIVDALFVVVVVVVLMTRAKVNKGVENDKRSSVCPPDLGMTRRILTQTLGWRKEQT